MPACSRHDDEVSYRCACGEFPGDRRPTRRPVEACPSRLSRYVLLALLLPALAAATAAAPLWIDVRTAEEFAAGHIPGAHHIHYTEVGVRINELTRDPDADIRVYCAVGVRAQVAKLKLEFAGFRNVTNAGGLAAAQAAWKKSAGGSVECGAASAGSPTEHQGESC